jgi:pyruvate dehydrogenase E1 component alpha subunit
MTTTTIDQAAAQLAGHQGFSIISNETLRQLYISMVKSRLLEARLGASTGREAAAVGVLAGVLAEDAVTAAHSDFVVRFLKNELQGNPLAELLNRSAEPDFAGQLKLALQTAQANQKAKKSTISAVFSESDSGFSEKLLKQAGAKRLPILFVRHTNLLSEIPEGKATIIPVIPVDGRDVVAIYRVATESITHARKGNGPTLIECVFDPTEALDPIQKMEAYLTRKGLFSEEWKRKEADGFARSLDGAVPVKV